MSSPLSSGALLGPYELLLPLPRTGAAQVWVARIARASGFRSHLALKTISRSYFEDVPTEHLLLEQAALAARIHHSNLVETLDLGEHDDTLYLATEWVDGEPLQTVVTEATRRGGVPLSIAVNIAAQLCRGLHAIHEHCDAEGAPLGAVHGHVSLQNLVLAYNGTVKLCDFGIAYALDRLSFLTTANQRNHKLTFAAPEQLSSRPVDRRSDVFSVGTLLYLLTTSSHPFEGGNMRATLNNICSGQPAFPSGADYPKALREVLSKALRKVPDERFGSALELGSALESAVPDAFHSEQTLAAYVDELCADHKREFHAQMHAAEARHDKSGASALFRSASVIPGSLRGVAIDSTEDADSEQRPSRSKAGPVVVGSPLVVALLAIFTGCLALSLGLVSRVEKVPRAAPASQAVTPKVGLSLPSPVAVAQPSASVTAPIHISELPRAPKLAERLARTPRISPPSRALPRSVGSASSDAGADSAKNSLTTSPKRDSWDPSTFGGRY